MAEAGYIAHALGSCEWCGRKAEPTQEGPAPAARLNLEVRSLSDFELAGSLSER